MSTESTLLRLWNESAATFANSGYALFDIEAQIVCMMVLTILFLKKQNSSDQTESQLIWSNMLFVQILYFLSEIFRVLIDIHVLPNSLAIQYTVAALNFGLFAFICLLMFIYTETYQKSKLLDSLRNKILLILPFAFNIVNLIISPYTKTFMYFSGSSMENGIFFPLMVFINLSYPVSAVILAMMRRRRMGKYERDNVSIMTIYPAFFLICSPIQALNWKFPILCYAIMMSDIFVYINYADSLVSLDPLTNIPNRNELIRNLSERLKSENVEKLYVFAVDVDDLGAINSEYGRSEGDRALILITNALKKFRQEEHECYVSRYYGDEFILSAYINDEEELKLFTEHIRNYISNAVIAKGLPYPLRVSIGHSRYEKYSRTETISGMIEEADRLMNENKEQRKFQSLWKRGRTA